MLSSDFKAFAQCFSVPHVIDTPDKKAVLKTYDELRILFEKVVKEYKDSNVTNMIRYCELAEFRGPFKIEATHCCHVMSGDQRVMEPYFGFSVIEFIDERWQLTSTQYVADQQTSVGRLLHTMLDHSTVVMPARPDTPNSKKETKQ